VTGAVAEGLAFRCSALSRALGESPAATASTVRSWFLLEQPGPWGPDIPGQSRLPHQVARSLRAAAQLGIRIVLIRRHGRSDPATRHCYLSWTSPRGHWLEHAVLDSPWDVLGADLEMLARGDPPGLGTVDEGPLFLVCTNGRRDPCCAEQGRPLARALDREFGDRAWECSHIGGDRFAGNLVCLPHGLYFGRLDPASGPRVARAYAAGRIDLEHYRGRAAYDFPVQAAEHFLRQALGLTGIDDVALSGRERRPDGVVVARFAGPSGSLHAVAVELVPVEPRRLTCHAHDLGRPRSFRLVGLD